MEYGEGNFVASVCSPGGRVPLASMYHWSHDQGPSEGVCLLGRLTSEGGLPAEGCMPSVLGGICI